MTEKLIIEIIAGISFILWLIILAREIKHNSNHPEL